MRVKSPSKHTPLKTLKAIQENNYIGMTGNEYHADEIDEIIMQKETKQIVDYIEQQLKKAA